MKTHLQELEEVWLGAWQRELGVDAELTSEEQTKLHDIRQRYSNEMELDKLQSLEACSVTSGEMVAMENSLKGERVVSVGAVGTKRGIAICGIIGADDEVESWANARLIAKLWNQSQND